MVLYVVLTRNDEYACPVWVKYKIIFVLYR